MKTEKKINTFATINKLEILSSFESPINHNIFILENEPFPGYYIRLNTPQEPYTQKDKSLFLIIDRSQIFQIDAIIRVTYKVIKNLNLDFDPCPAIIQIHNNMHYAVRIKYTDVDLTEKIIDEYKNEGMGFLKKKKMEEYETRILLKKFIGMEYMDEGIYFDEANKNIAYIQMPRFARWDDFVKITEKLKNNHQLKMFDAAKCSILGKRDSIEFIRIFATGGYGLDNLKLLKEKYHSIYESYYK
ncbi:MAG: hypothetical protein ABFS35_20415 [Bacteroidota bacterium]